MFSRTGTLTDNCHIENFNGIYRYECLNSNYFNSLTSARKIIEDCWTEYNEEYPQKNLKRMTPDLCEDLPNKLKNNSSNGRKVEGGQFQQGQRCGM